MFYVYILKSQKWKRVYIGYSHDLKRRLKEHNFGKVKSTKHGIPWVLIYYEAFLSKEDAIKRELQLKKYGSAIGFLKRRIKNSLDKV